MLVPLFNYSSYLWTAAPLSRGMRTPLGEATLSQHFFTFLKRGLLENVCNCRDSSLKDLSRYINNPSIIPLLFKCSSKERQLYQVILSPFWKGFTSNGKNVPPPPPPHTHTHLFLGTLFFFPFIEDTQQEETVGRKANKKSKKLFPLYKMTDIYQNYLIPLKDMDYEIS